MLHCTDSVKIVFSSFGTYHFGGQYWKIVVVDDSRTIQRFYSQMLAIKTPN